MTTSVFSLFLLALRRGEVSGLLTADRVLPVFMCGRPAGFTSPHTSSGVGLAGLVLHASHCVDEDEDALHHQDEAARTFHLLIPSFISCQCLRLFTSTNGLHRTAALKSCTLFCSTSDPLPHERRGHKTAEDEFTKIKSE